jgi:hypothetical protein
LDNPPKVGDVVIYCDKYGNDHNALVTVFWGDAVNLVIVSADKDKQDTYGRQIEHESSVSHVGPHCAHGRYWRFASENRIEYKEPVSV